MSTHKISETSSHNSPQNNDTMSAMAGLTICTPSYAGNSVYNERPDPAHPSHDKPNMAWHLLDSHGPLHQSSHEPGLSWNQDIAKPLSYLGAQFNVMNEENINISPGPGISSLAPAHFYPASLDIGLSTAAPEDLDPNDDKTLYTPNDSPCKDRQSSNIHGIQDDVELLTYTYKRPWIVVDDDQGRPTMPIADDFLFCSSYDDSVRPSTLVRSAYQLSAAFNRLWIARLAPDFDLVTKCMELSPKKRFALGTNVLRRCFLGTLPSTFKELYAMIYVAFAFSHTIHRDVDSCYWDAFSRDLYRWRLALSTQSDVEIFLRVWHRLWCPQRFCGPFPQKDSSDCESYMANNNSSCPGITFSFEHPAVVRQSSGQRFTDTIQDTSYDIFMGGIVIKGCSRFFDCECEPICDHNYLTCLQLLSMRSFSRETPIALLDHL